MSLKLVLLVGSVRCDRQGIKAARFVERSLTARGHDVTLVDPVATGLPLLDRMYKEYETGTAPQILESLATLYRAADAFVVITGEYNHSIPPALSNLLQSLSDSVDSDRLRRRRHTARSRADRATLRSVRSRVGMVRRGASRSSETRRTVLIV